MNLLLYVFDLLTWELKYFFLTALATSGLFVFILLIVEFSKIIKSKN